ncbi:MAG: GntR family transcriptional regulator [Lachnospiraceae bacterium]|nr:GntR family transcriptional regulator [Lachnospiraceae bacterium]
MQKQKKVDYNSPMYLQLRELIRSKIEDEEYASGTAIPSENILAATYGVNRLTVRSAVDALVQEGILKRVQGKGVYVTTVYERDLEVLGGFTQTMNEREISAKKKILQRGERPAGDKIASILNLQPDDPVYYVRRLDYADDEPIGIQEIYIPLNLVPNIEKVDLTIFSMFEIYQFYGIQPSYADQTLDLVRLIASDARLLGIPKEQSVFRFCDITYTEDGRAIEYCKAYTRGDRSNFHVHFQKEA